MAMVFYRLHERGRIVGFSARKGTKTVYLPAGVKDWTGKKIKYDSRVKITTLPVSSEILTGYPDRKSFEKRKCGGLRAMNTAAEELIANFENMAPVPEKGSVSIETDKGCYIIEIRKTL